MKLKPLVAAAVVALTSLGSQAADVDWGTHGVLETSGPVIPAVGSFLDTYSFTLDVASNLGTAFVASGISFGSLGLYHADGTATPYSWAFGGFTALSDTLTLGAGSYVFAISGKAGSAAAYNLSSIATAAPVPEPETYAMLMAGLGVVGFVARRRRSN